MNRELELVRIYNSAAKEIRQGLLGIDITGFNEAMALNVMKKTKTLLLRLNLAAERWSRQAVNETYSLAQRRSRVSLEILGKKPMKKHRLPQSSAKRIGEVTLGFLVKANGSMRRTAERYISTALLASNTLKYAQVQEFSFDDAGDLLSRYALEAVIKEQSRGELKRRILDYLRGLITDDNLIEIKGKMWRAGKYAEMVARTTLREAQTQATVDLCREYDNDLVQVSDHQTICDICKEYEGKIYSLSGASDKYDRLPEDPPWHPNCQHGLLPTSEEAIAIEAERS